MRPTEAARFNSATAGWWVTLRILLSVSPRRLAHRELTPRNSSQDRDFRNPHTRLVRLDGRRPDAGSGRRSASATGKPPAARATPVRNAEVAQSPSRLFP